MLSHFFLLILASLLAVWYGCCQSNLHTHSVGCLRSFVFLLYSSPKPSHSCLPNGEAFILVGTSDVDSSSCMKKPSGAEGYTVTRAVGRCNTSLLSLSSHEFSVSELAIRPIARIVSLLFSYFLLFTSTY